MTEDQEKKIAEAAEAWKDAEEHHEVIMDYPFTSAREAFKAGAALGLQMGEERIAKAISLTRASFEKLSEENARLKADVETRLEMHKDRLTILAERDALKAEIERLQTVNLAISRNTLDAEKLKAQNEKLREALEHFATKPTYVEHPPQTPAQNSSLVESSAIARQALAEVSE